MWTGRSRDQRTTCSTSWASAQTSKSDHRTSCKNTITWTFNLLHWTYLRVNLREIWLSDQPQRSSCSRLWSLEAAANGKDYFSSRTNKISHCIFHRGEAAVNRTSQSAHVLLQERNGTLYIRSFGWAVEFHLAADKSIWDECWSPGGGLEESLTSSGFSHWALSTEPFEAAGWTAAGEKCG